MTAPEQQTDTVRQDSTATRPRGWAVAAVLKETREELGYSLQDVSAAINVRVAQLEAIENADFDSLPGKTYAVGFIRAYARHLNLDAESIVMHFKKEYGPAAEKPDLNAAVPATESQVPGLLLVIGGCALALVIFVLWLVFSGDDENISAVPEVPAEIKADITPDIAPNPQEAVSRLPDQPEEAPTVVENLLDMPPQEDEPVIQVEPPPPEVEEPDAAPAAVAALPAPKPKPPVSAAPSYVSNGKSRITLEARKTSWVEIFDGEGNNLLSRVMKKGDKYLVPDKPGIVLTTGNAGVIDVYVDGQLMPPLGKPGAVMRNVSLDPEELLKRARRQR